MGLFLSDVEFEVEERQTRHDTEAWIDAWRQDKDIVAYFLGELEFYRNRLIFLNNVCERLKTRVIRINKHEEKKEG